MKKRVLVVDDDEDILEILDILFDVEGYDVITLNKETSVMEIQLLHPDLVLLDVMIKGSAKTGDQICQEIKSWPATQNLPVILISAEYDIPFLAARSGADSYFNKPFDIDHMLVKVKELLG